MRESRLTLELPFFWVNDSHANATQLCITALTVYCSSEVRARRAETPEAGQSNGKKAALIMSQRNLPSATMAQAASTGSRKAARRRNGGQGPVLSL